MKISFKEWMIDEIRISGQAFAATDSAEREYGRQQNQVVAQTIKNKMGWDYEVTPIGSHEDVSLKIDGRFTSGDFANKTIQISVRTAKNAREDISYKMTSRPMDIEEIINVPFTELVKKNPSKASASVDLFIMRNADDNHIYICEDTELKRALQKLLASVRPFFKESDLIPKGVNRYSASFKSGLDELRLAPSELGHSLIAYLHAPSNAIVDIPITAADTAKAVADLDEMRKQAGAEERKKQQMLSQVPDGMSLPQFEKVQQVIDGTLPVFLIPVSNNANKRKSIEKFLQKKNLNFNIVDKNYKITKKA